MGIIITVVVLLHINCFATLTGYLNNPKATAESITPDGWFHSGDTGYYDDEGHFYIVDRLKDLVKYKGFQVNCSR